MLELLLEIDRHHRDFAQISALVHDALDTTVEGYTIPAKMEAALKAIRNVVG